MDNWRNGRGLGAGGPIDLLVPGGLIGDGWRRARAALRDRTVVHTGQHLSTTFQGLSTAGLWIDGGPQRSG
jgi:hypothetical protein